MTTIKLHGEEISNIFQLIGTKENDITLSLSWVLSNCPEFLKGVIQFICHVKAQEIENIEIACQEFEKGKGFTDIEIKDDKSFHVIIEAKRGWNLAGKEQITKYSQRKSFVRSQVKNKYIVSLSECTQQYAAKWLPNITKNGIPVMHCSYREIFRIALESYPNSNHAQKRMIDEFCQYMKGWMTMQNLHSNWVYVVSLSKGCPGGCDISFVEIVKKYKKYFHPCGISGWPKEPPNYIAFRYDGKLQSIHHIEKYTLTSNLHDEVKAMPDYEEDCDYFVYRLGPAIIPQKDIRTGKIYRNGRVWAMLDTLLTCDTISEARDLSYQRSQQEND